MTRLTTLLAAAALAFVVPACSEFGSVCKAQAACEGGNDKDIAACAESFEGEENASDAYGCLDKFDAVATCAAGATCVNGNFSADCSAQEKDLNDCIKAGSAKK